MEKVRHLYHIFGQFISKYLIFNHQLDDCKHFSHLGLWSRIRRNLLNLLFKNKHNMQLI